VTPPSPRVSVVVPTRDRPERLESLLAGLERQTLPAAAFEVIVVDDGSEASSTQHVLAQAAARAPFELRTLRNDRPAGQARARNDGWRQARGGLVAFTDDDCVPAPDWLEAALAVASAEPELIVQGRTEPDPIEFGRRTAFSRTVSIEALGASFQTCNIFYPRALLERLDGFDDEFGQPVVGEDTDLAWRAFEQGVRAEFASDAVVFHAVHNLGPLGSLREARRWGGVARVFRRHPEARAALSRGVFWNGWHYCLIRSAVALALPRPLRPLRRALLTHHLLQLYGRAREGQTGPWAIPFLLLYDAVEFGAVARGGVRYRVFVL
jgi:glycosyltransferase involved in cell wall biosynthesis